MKTKTLKPPVDNQLAQPKTLEHKITLVTIIFLLIVLSIIGGVYLSRISDPYVQTVLSLEGDSMRGQAIFEINCAACHGREADGSVGPSLQKISRHKSQVNLINQVISGKTPPMPKFQPTPQEMADLLSYLETL